MKPAVISIAALCMSMAIGFVAVPAFGHEPRSLTQPNRAQRRAVRVPIREFVLTDQTGRPFDFKTLRHKVIVLAFAYTTCPDVCPLITAAMRQVQSGLTAAEHGSVYLLTITTDPEVDDPHVLSAYANRYGADVSNWAFLTGRQAVLQAVWRNFGIRVERKARGLIDHTSLTAVIDGTGTMRFAYYGASPNPNVVLKDLRSLLTE